MESNIKTSHLRILIVEDEPFQRRILAAVLRSLGISRICEVDSAAAAIARLQTEIINAVLSDVDMPESNGLELLRQIRIGQTPAPRDIGFIILTSHSNTEVLSAAMALDVNGFIVKPFTTRVILEKITRTTDERIRLRSKSEYTSVATDLTSLRRTRFSGNHDGSDSLEPAASAAGRGQITIPLSDLRVGMCVATNLTAIDGTVILAAETTITSALNNLLSDLEELIADKVITVHDPNS